MRAVVLRRAGSADGLALTEVPKPTADPGEVLVRIRATSVTRGDVVLRKMPKLVTRLVGETPKSILGHEFAGDVEEVGEGVTSLAIGDRVFGTTTGLRQGSYAEYITIPAHGLVATIPTNVSYEESAPVPVGAMTALHFLRSAGVGSDKRVLVNGASGSVGSFAVQIAKHLGSHVTGVSSTSNLELVESLGADEVIDYTKQDFTHADKTYDLIFDAVGKRSAKHVAGVLAESGAFVTTQTRRHETIEELLAVRELLEAGALRAVIERRYTLEQIPEAHRHVERGRKRGNVLIVVES
ncbi:MAG: NAD(P)-dependent alcohol dehydrogenase [Acidimicrobiia bacterium]